MGLSGLGLGGRGAVREKHWLSGRLKQIKGRTIIGQRSLPATSYSLMRLMAIDFALLFTGVATLLITCTRPTGLIYL